MKMNIISYVLVSVFIFSLSKARVVNYYNWHFYKLCPEGAKAVDTTTTTTPKPIECKNTEVLTGAELYWRDYRPPSVPEDALIVGMNNEGEKISLHVGQVLVDVQGAGIQPVGIRNDSSTVKSTYTRPVTIDNNIKILCTNVEPHLIDHFLVWIPIESAKKLSPEDLVVTGWEHIKDRDIDGPIWSGRSVHDGHMVVGKVVEMNKGFRLFYPKEEKEIELEKDFEVLVYASALKKVNEQ